MTRQKLKGISSCLDPDMMNLFFAIMFVRTFLSIYHYDTNKLQFNLFAFINFHHRPFPSFDYFHSFSNHINDWEQKSRTLFPSFVFISKGKVY